MPKYEIKINEDVVHTITVEADNSEEAVSLAFDQYGNFGEDNLTDGVESHTVESEGSRSYTIYDN
jgi:hypothetical protein